MHMLVYAYICRRIRAYACIGVWMRVCTRAYACIWVYNMEGMRAPEGTRRKVAFDLGEMHGPGAKETFYLGEMHGPEQR